MKKIACLFLLFSSEGLSAQPAEIGFRGESGKKPLAPKASLRFDKEKSVLTEAHQQDTGPLPHPSEVKKEPVAEESPPLSLSLEDASTLQKNSLLEGPERDSSVEKSSPQSLSLEDASVLQENGLLEESERDSSVEKSSPQSLSLEDASVLQENSLLEESEKDSSIEKSSPLSLSLENAFVLQKNSLLKKPEDWTLKIPYTEIQAAYRFSGQSLFEAGFDVSYQNKDWAYSVDSLFVRHEWTAGIPLSFQAGWFFYPVSYFEENEKLFAKKLLAQKSLFPLKHDRGMGILLEGNVFGSFYLRGAIMAPEGMKDVFRETRVRPTFIGSFIYRKKDQDFFMSLLRKDFFLEGEETALGFGLNQTYKTGSWLLGARGEFWDINRSQPARVLFSYYLFPYFKWKFMFFGALFGGAHHYLRGDRSHAFEYVLKGGAYATKNLFFTVERIYEKDSLTQNNSWAFSLKTEFNID